jgi:hypothetical protein
MSGDAPNGPPDLEPYDSPGHPFAEFFGAARRGRRERYAAWTGKPRSPRSRSLVTMVHNEPVFLPIWLGYYSRFFRPEDIYVLDNDTTDRSTVRGGFVRIPVSHGCVDQAWTLRTIQRLQHQLAQRYDVVVVCDVDEIIAPVPERGTLGEYLDRIDEEWVNCLGYEILHMRDEPPLDPTRPILDQRGHWYINTAYDKAAIATVPLNWRLGFHGRADGALNPDPDLRLIHLHRVDYGICLERHRLRRRRRWAPEDLELGWGGQNRITDEAEFERWFYEDSGFDNIEIAPEPIPPSWRGLF